jgi:hypothetical protein
MASNTPSPPKKPRGPSMRTPTNTPANIVYGDTAQTSDRIHASTAAQQAALTSQRGHPRDRYRPSALRVEGDAPEGFTDGRTAPARVFNDTGARRPASAQRRDSYPPEEERRASVLSQARRDSIETAAGNRPRGLSFYDAREFMKSGRPPRPESWHGGAPPQAWQSGDPNAPSTPPTPSRKRVTSANVEEGIPPAPGGSPPSAPPPMEKGPRNVGWALFMNSSFKNNLVATLGEIVGTTMFLFFAFAGTQVANVNSNIDDTTTTNATVGFNVSKLMYIALSFGFSLMVNVWIFFRISGGLFNPAVCMPRFPLSLLLRLV